MEQKNHKSWMVNFISVILILGVFAVSCLVLMNIGIRVYMNIVVANNNNFELRTSLSYVATKVRSNDMDGYPKLEDKDGTQVLILGETLDHRIYETLIYYLDGVLYEIYQEQGNEYELDYGTEMMEIADFTITMTEDGMLKLTACNQAHEEETLILSLRSGGH